MNLTHVTTGAFRKLQNGLTLIELMVALAIGAFLMIGTITVFVQSRTTLRVTESIARLQENGRFALDSIEPDIRMAHYWGLTTRTNRIQGRAGSTDPAGVGPNTCGNNWAIDLDNALDGTNNNYAWGCAATGGAAAGSDTLVVRRVSEDRLPALLATPNTLYVQTARFQDSRIFRGPPIPAGYAAWPTSATHLLVVNGYYVSQGSALGPNIPSLRRKTLRNSGVIEDEEVLPWVEDLQIQFGVDTDAVGTPDRGSIDRYVNPGDPILTPGDPNFIADAEILGVRIWLRVRADRPENGHDDTANRYVYADQDFTPVAPDSFRRIVVSKTIYLRNARPPS